MRRRGRFTGARLTSSVTPTKALIVPDHQAAAAAQAARRLVWAFSFGASAPLDWDSRSFSEPESEQHPVFCGEGVGVPRQNAKAVSRLGTPALFIC